MILTPLNSHNPAAIREALQRRGFKDVHAQAAARGLKPVAVVFDDISGSDADALARAAQSQGVECLTGAGWALLAGGASELAAVARGSASTVPHRMAEALGRYISGTFEEPVAWQMSRGFLSLDRPLIVGILNVTPDSFSDAGKHLHPAAALDHAERMLRDGADMLDVGAESTRPGRPKPITASEEWRRLGPVLEGLTERHPGVPISVDTVRSVTAKRAMAAGAWAINDVSGLRLDPEIADVCAELGAGLVLMHSRGSVTNMATYDNAEYRDVVPEVMRELEESVGKADARGVPRDRIVLDPGLGFAKTPEQTLAAISGIPALAALGFPVMVGPSRKRFLGALIGAPVDDRDRATAAACVAAYFRGATLFRVHNVAAAREALDVAHAIGSN